MGRWCFYHHPQGEAGGLQLGSTQSSRPPRQSCHCLSVGPTNSSWTRIVLLMKWMEFNTYNIGTNIKLPGGNMPWIGLGAANNEHSSMSGWALHCQQCFRHMLWTIVGRVARTMKNQVRTWVSLLLNPVSVNKAAQSTLDIIPVHNRLMQSPDCWLRGNGEEMLPSSWHQ